VRSHRVGVSTGTIYTYFPNKEEIFATLARRYRAHMEEWRKHAIAGLKDPLSKDGLRKLAVAVKSLMYEGSESFLIILSDVIEFRNQHFRFFTAAVFRPQVTVGFPVLNPDATRRDVEQFMLAYDSDLAPIVGQQVTLTSSNSGVVGARIDLLKQRAGTSFISKSLGGTVTECDLVARVPIDGRVKGFLFDPTSNSFIPDDGTANLSDSALRGLAATPGQEVTYTCVPPGSGTRVAFGQ